MAEQSEPKLYLYAAEGNADLLKNVVDGHSPWLLCQAFEVAAANGHLACVKILHPLQQGDTNNRALQDAAYNGHVEVVAYLLAQGFCVANDELYESLQNGHWACAEELMPHCSNMDFSDVLTSTFEWDDNGVEDPTFIPRVRQTLVDFRGAEQLLQDISDFDSPWYGCAKEWLDEGIAQQQKTHIEQQINDSHVPRPRKM